MVCVACFHMASGFAIMHLHNIYFILLFLSIPFLHFLLIWYQWIGWNGRRYQRVLACCALLTWVILTGLTLWKCVSDVCVCVHVLFYICVGAGFVDWLESGFIYKKNFEMCICLWWSLIVPRWPCAVYRTLKSSYQITNQTARFVSKIGRPFSLFHRFMPFFDKESAALVCILVWTLALNQEGGGKLESVNQTEVFAVVVGAFGYLRFQTGAVCYIRLWFW